MDGDLFRECFLHFFLVGWHGVSWLQTVKSCALHTRKPDGASGHIDGHIAAADDDNLAGYTWIFSEVDLLQEFYTVHDLRKLFSLKTQVSA